MNKDNLSILHEIINELNLEIAKFFSDEHMSFLKYESNGFDFNIKLFNTFLVYDDYVDIVEITINKERMKEDIRKKINTYLDNIKEIKI